MELTLRDIEVIKQNLLKDIYFKVNEFILEDFKNNLDATPRTKETYINGVIKFINWCEENNITEVTHETLLKYKYDLLENYKASSVSTYITAIKQLYKFLETKGITNIASNIKGAKQRKRHLKDPLTLEQAKRLLKSIDRTTDIGKRNFAILYLFITTGLRTIELERADIEDIRNIADKSVLYIMGKGHDEKDDYVQLTYETLQAISNYLATRKIKSSKEPLFVSHSDRTNGQRLKKRSIRHIVKTAFLNIGINSDKITTHSLRHTAITLCLIGGATLQEAQEMARHVNINTTLDYANNLEKIQSKAEQSIQNLLNS